MDTGDLKTTNDEFRHRLTDDSMPSIRARHPRVGRLLQSHSKPECDWFLYEDTGRYRQVFTDGRPLPDDPDPSWGGYSIGHWDGDTLVVESAGFNDKSWLDFAGHPHTEALRVTERFRRIDFGRMELQLTIDDPKAYRRSWTVPVDIRIAPDTDLLEDVCNDNERSSQHFTPPAGEPVPIATNILARLVGIYEERPQQQFVVTLVGDELLLQRPGTKSAPPSSRCQRASY